MITLAALARVCSVETVVSGCLAALAPFLVALGVDLPGLQFVLYETLNESQNAPYMRPVGWICSLSPLGRPHKKTWID